MPQYFLKGWISAYPGEGLMKFTLPPDTTDATWNITLHSREDWDYITIEHGFSASSGETAHAWVKWNNTKDEDIPFDYEITPSYTSPDEGDTVALDDTTSTEGQVVNGD